MSPRHLVLVAAVATLVGSVVMLPVEVDAGSAPAEISCTAKDTGEVLSGTIPRDSDDLDLTFKDGKGHEATWKDTEQLMFASDVKEHVLQMHIDGKTKLTFWALPKTMKVESKRHEEHASFDAKLELVGFGEDTAPRTLRLRCKYDYEI